MNTRHWMVVEIQQRIFQWTLKVNKPTDGLTWCDRTTLTKNSDVSCRSNYTLFCHRIDLNEWGGNYGPRMITWTRLGTIIAAATCLMNCNAWEVDNPHVYVRCISLWESRTHYRPLSPIIAAQWVSWLLYSLFSKDFWSHGYDQLYSSCCYAAWYHSILLLSKGKVITRIKPDEGLRADSRFDSLKLIEDWITCFHYHRNIIQTCYKEKSNQGEATISHLMMKVPGGGPESTTRNTLNGLMVCHWLWPHLPFQLSFFQRLSFFSLRLA